MRPYPIENQRFFCTLFGATFTLILNLFWDLIFLRIFVNVSYLNLPYFSIKTNTFTKSCRLNFINSLKNMIVKKMIVLVLKILGFVLGIVVLYIALAFALPFIKVSAKDDGQKKEIPVYIYTNGVHTDMVMPVRNELQDWSTKIPFANTKSKRTDYQYVGIGWGDKGFYLDTPTWADLKFSTAFKAAFWLSKSAMHCTYYKTMTEGSDCKKIMISKNQYRKLVEFVEDKFDRDASGNFILVPTDAVYGDNDAFYDAKGKYSFLYTCNTWTNDALKAAGQKAAFWTPSDYGIFLHYK